MILQVKAPDRKVICRVCRVPILKGEYTLCIATRSNNGYVHQQCLQNIVHKIEKENNQ